MGNAQVEVLPEALAKAKEAFRAALVENGIPPETADSFFKANEEAIKQPTLNTAYTQLTAADKANTEKMNSEIAKNAALTEDNKKKLTEALYNLESAYFAQVDQAHALMINSAAANQHLNRFQAEGRGAETPDVAEPGAFIGGAVSPAPGRESSGNLIDQLMKGEIHTLRDPQSNRCLKYDPDTETLSADHPDLLVEGVIAGGHTEFTFTEGDPAAVFAAAEKMIAAGISPTIDPSLVQKWKTEATDIETKSKSMWNKEYWLKSTPFIESRDAPHIEAINTIGQAMKTNYSVTPPDNTLAANNAKVYEALEAKINSAQVSKDEKSDYQIAQRAMKVFLGSAYGRDQRSRWELSDQDTLDNRLSEHLSKEDTLNVRRAEFTDALAKRGIEPAEANKFFRSNTPLTQRGALATEMQAAEATLHFKSKDPSQRAGYYARLAVEAINTNDKQVNTAVKQIAKLPTSEFSAKERSDASVQIFAQLSQHPDQKFAAKKMAEIVAPLIHNKGISAAERRDIIDALRAEAANAPDLKARIAQTNLIDQIDGPNASKSLASWVKNGAAAFNNLPNKDKKVEYLVNNVYNPDLAKKIAREAKAEDTPAIGEALAKHVEDFHKFAGQDGAEKYLLERVAPLLSAATPEKQKAIVEAMGNQMVADMAKKGGYPPENGLEALQVIERKLAENPKQNRDAIEKIQELHKGMRLEVDARVEPTQQAPNL